MNLNDLSYTITGFTETGIPIVTFNCDGSSQVMGSCPVDSSDSTQAYLNQYVLDYVAGLKEKTTTPSQDVQDLVDQTITPGA